MKKNKLTLYLTFVIILFVVVLYISLKDDYKDILTALNDVNILFLLIGIFFMFLSKYFLGETLYFLGKKEKPDLKIKDMVLIELIYPFFAGTHASDMEAVQLYNQYVEQYEMLRQQTEQSGVALTQMESAADGTYTWLHDPWPWDYETEA